MEKGMKDTRIEQRLKREMEALYGNEGLTGDLDDQSAKPFLDWAEDHVRQIVGGTAELEDAAADEVIYPRMKAMRRIARYVNQALSDQGEPYDLAEKIVAQARILYGKAFVEPDINKIQSLLTMLKVEPELFFQALKHLLEGDTNGKEAHLQL